MIQTLQDPTSLPALDPHTPYTYPEAPINYDYVENDIVDPVAPSDNSLDYAESQRVEHAWNDAQVLPVDDLAKPSRLDTYAKEEIRPALDLAQKHDGDYTGEADNVYNEHSQQR